MKIGDVVMSTKVRPYDNATITDVDVEVSKKNGKKSIKTKYKAEFADGSSFIFYGFNINKSVFKVMTPDGQIALADFMNLPEQEEIQKELEELDEL